MSLKARGLCCLAALFSTFGCASTAGDPSSTGSAAGMGGVAVTSGGATPTGGTGGAPPLGGTGGTVPEAGTATGGAGGSHGGVAGTGGDGSVAGASGAGGSGGSPGQAGSGACTAPKLLCDDFESGSLSKFKVLETGGKLSLDATHVYSGAASALLTIPANQRGGFLEAAGAPLFPSPATPSGGG